MKDCKNLGTEHHLGLLRACLREVLGVRGPEKIQSPRHRNMHGFNCAKDDTKEERTETICRDVFDAKIEHSLITAFILGAVGSYHLISK